MMTGKPIPPHVLANRAADAERRPSAFEAAVHALALVFSFCGLVAAIAFGLSLILGSAGCATLRDYDPADAPGFAPDGTNRVPRAALVVHLTAVDPRKWGGWGGACPGADTDAAAVAAALDAQGIPYIALSNEAATVSRVLASAAAVGGRVAKGGLIMLYFAGHGGRQSDFGGDEIDNADETICLWDGPLADDTVWSMLEKVPAGVRTWLVTDCCNSGSNFRHAPPHDYARGVARWWRPKPALLHFGAARDGGRAYSSPRGGGFFTSALRTAWEPGLTYASWFRRAADAVREREPSQTPAMNWIGEDFSEREAWR